MSIENSKKQMQRKLFDYFAFILLAFALSSSLFTLNTLEHGSLNIPMTFVFVVSLALFIIRSLISKKAFLNIRILGFKPLLFGFIAYSIYQFCMLGSNFIIPNYLAMGVGLSSSLAGFALFPGALVGAIASPFFGKMYDKYGAKLPFYLGNAIFCVILIILSLFTHTLVFWNMTILYVFFIVGRTLPFNNIVPEALRSIGAEQRADGNAIFQMGQQFFGALGTTAAALIINNAPNVTVGVQHNFRMMLVLSVIIFGLFVLMFRALKKNNGFPNQG